MCTTIDPSCEIWNYVEEEYEDDFESYAIDLAEDDDDLGFFSAQHHPPPRRCSLPTIFEEENEDEIDI